MKTKANLEDGCVTSSYSLGMAANTRWALVVSARSSKASTHWCTPALPLPHTWCTFPREHVCISSSHLHSAVWGINQMNCKSPGFTSFTLTPQHLHQHWSPQPALRRLCRASFTGGGGWTGTAGGDTHPSGNPFIMDDVSAKLFRPRAPSTPLPHKKTTRTNKTHACTKTHAKAPVQSVPSLPLSSLYRKHPVTQTLILPNHLNVYVSTASFFVPRR